jgi:hypothetical protein
MYEISARANKANPQPKRDAPSLKERVAKNAPRTNNPTWTARKNPHGRLLTMSQQG